MPRSGHPRLVDRAGERVEPLDHLSRPAAVGRPGPSGQLFNPRSVQEIADAIDRLWSSQDTLEKAEARIRERRSRMSWEPFREAYRQAYSYALQEAS